MRLTDEQFNALLPYQKQFETMVNARWARLPGRSALDLIHDIYVKVSGDTSKFSKSCSNCINRLMMNMGKIFLADREERRKMIEETIKEETGIDVNVVREVAVKESLTTEPIKTEVKVKRGGRKKKTE